MNIEELDLYWLAGILEAEGSFSAGTPSNPTKPLITVNSVDQDVVARIAKLFNTSPTYNYPKRNQEHGWKPYYSAKLTGRRAVELMKLLRPLMGARRQSQIDHAIACYVRDNRLVLEGERLESIKRRLQNGEHVITLANEFGVSKSYAYLIRQQLSK